MTTLRLLCAAGLACACLLFSACGGGGGDPAATATPTGQAEAVQASALPMSADMQQTHRALDVAVDGEGLLVGHDVSTGDRVYARWGRLDLDATGRLVHAQGGVLGGVSPDIARAHAGEDLAGLEAPLPAVPWRMASKADTRLTVVLNLDARRRLSAGQPDDTRPFDPQHPITYHGAGSFSLTDDTGAKRTFTLFFRSLSGDMCWGVEAMVDGSLVAHEADDAWHRLCFEATGAGVEDTMHAVLPASWAGAGRSSQPLRVDFAATQFAGDFGVSFFEHDGYPAGLLQAVAIGETGLVTAHYDNGQQHDHAQLLLARPALADAYRRVGAVGWQCAGRCSTPVMAMPGQRLTGLLRSGWLSTRF